MKVSGKKMSTSAGADRLSMLVAALFVAALTFCSCGKDNPQRQEDGRKVFRVAVVLPMSGGLQEHWERTLDLLMSNVYRASEGIKPGIGLEFEWHDEDKEDMSSLAVQLQKDDKVAAVIGGMYSADAHILEQLSLIHI